MTSTKLLVLIATQFSHTSQGFSVGPWTQFTAFANIRASDVFPTPLGPVNRYAWGIFPDLIEFLMVVMIWG
jgi:hypothetical protein